MKTIINLAGKTISAKAIEKLSKYLQIINLNYDEVKSLDFDESCIGILTSVGLVVDAELIDKFPQLRFIATPTTGLDHIDCGYADSRGISIISLRGETDFLSGISSTAEIAFGLMLDLSRGISSSFNDVKMYSWDREKFRQPGLNGGKLGILGFGRLGRIMSRYGNAFFMDVVGYDPYVDKSVFDECHCLKLESITELFKQADFLSIHLPLNSETKCLVNKSLISLMKPDAIIINTSRGDVVNEDDLLHALINKNIGGYGTDVLSGENSFGSEFKYNQLIEYAKGFDNLIITPHIGGMSTRARDLTDDFIVNKILDFINKSLLAPST